MNPLKWLAAGMVLLSACSGPTTYIVSRWKDPATTQIHFEKIAVIAATAKADIRRTTEDRLSRLIQNAAPTYPFVSSEKLLNPAAVQAQLQVAGYDGIVVMRLVSLKEELAYAPSSKGFEWEARDWEETSAPSKKQVAVIETLVFSVKEKKLLWSCRSETIDPGSLRKMLPAVVAAAREQIKKDLIEPANTPKP